MGRPAGAEAQGRGRLKRGQGRGGGGQGEPREVIKEAQGGEQGQTSESENKRFPICIFLENGAGWSTKSMENVDPTKNTYGKRRGSFQNMGKSSRHKNAKPLCSSIVKSVFPFPLAFGADV